MLNEMKIIVPYIINKNDDIKTIVGVIARIKTAITQTP